MPQMWGRHEETIYSFNGGLRERIKINTVFICCLITFVYLCGVNILKQQNIY
jgi:hypothetical protein